LKDYGKPLRKILTGRAAAITRSARAHTGPKPFTVPVTIPLRHLANKILTKDPGRPKAF